MRFAYEYRDDSGNWFRAYGNENWKFDAHGLMRRRYASINDLPIREADRLFDLGSVRSAAEGLSELERARPVRPIRAAGHFFTGA